jgi:hypothetical protein
MHKIKLGEFRYLVVIIHQKVEDGYRYLFYDGDHQATSWMLSEMTKVDGRVPQIVTLPDLNHLLNKLVKGKEEYIGQVLYEIFIENYPDGDHKNKVMDFWSKEKKV